MVLKGCKMSKKKKRDKKGIFRGTPVVGARSSKEMKKRGDYTRFGRFEKKPKAKSMKKDLKKVGRNAKIMKRSVRTRGGGPKIETSFSVYQKEGEK